MENCLIRKRLRDYKAIINRPLFREVKLLFLQIRNRCRSVLMTPSAVHHHIPIAPDDRTGLFWYSLCIMYYNL